MHDSTPAFPSATFVVIADGFLGKRIATLAQEHAAFDPDFRCVLRPDDALYPPSASIAPWSRRGAAALVVSSSGDVCALLDLQQATTAGWIEDAFLSAKRRPAL